MSRREDIGAACTSEYARSIETMRSPRRILASRLAERWGLQTSALAKRRARGQAPHRWIHVSRTAVAYDLEEVEAIEAAGASPRPREVQS
jgi:hypothetical protein